MKYIFLIQIFLFSALYSAAQVVPSPVEMQKVKVDELTDDQIRQIVEEMKKNNVSLNQIEGFARQKGIPAGEAAKLKSRIVSLNLEKELTFDRPSTSLEPSRGIDIENMTYSSAKNVQPVPPPNKKIFGSELFSNTNLTFEPNLRMPTPPNYRLAAGDEVAIDVYGYSEVQHKLKVSPEGYVRIPNLGPVYVTGLTMDEARNRITKQLGTIYSGIKNGNTFVQISLGTIRSIQVLLIGEVVRPGTYTIPSLASVANALYVSGGPDANGSFRDIQVVRAGSVIARFDLYDFLLNGDLTNNIILQDQDIVKVNPYKIRVELDGQVKRPGIFEAKEGESLASIINFAGGYTDHSYRDVIRASRITEKERQMITIMQNEVGTFSLRSGDKYFVDAVLDRFSNRVSITGAVFHPGDYQLEPNMTLNDLIKKADGLMEVASLSRGLIRRLKEDYTPSILNFNVQDVLSGKQQIALQREDSVVIFSKLQLQEKYQVKISGLVNNPGYFDFADSMHLEDLVLLAGGLQDAAYLKRVEISRRVRGREYNPADTQLAIVQQFEISTDLRSVPGANAFVLQPFDEITIRQSPTYSGQSTVMIEGEVVFPGAYTINSSKEKISDVLSRAGGLRAGAYPEGAMLLRKTYRYSTDSVLLNSKLGVFYNKLRDSSDIANVQREFSRKEQLVGIDLAKIISSPDYKGNLLVEDGDIIRIPKKLQTVQLFGEVYFPKKVRFDRAVRFREYIRRSGGFTNNALKKGSYVVHANGEVKSTRQVLFFRSFPKVQPGAEIYVPAKGDKKRLSTQEVVGLTTGVASLALIIFTILDRTK